ncbi:MAG: sulfite reductase [Gallionellales bacterium RIFCSPLOWO2_02_FULL_57_47]|nr:MAG: sulfite reductase [Gallionellales bacterium RIFCSPLOWO2_02_FULL_57_47]OGT11065.1 MAG: sulfite reductase [Gallionellales bacterium RIFCSPHIGHO2_02_FULL_57_16]
MEKILDKKRIDDWIAALTDWEVLAPALQDGIWTYKPVSGAARLDHPNTRQSPKELTFPQREIFFSFEQIKGEPPKLTQILPKETRHVVFGVRSCDGKGVPRMDKVFTDHVEDTYYTTRRKNVAYVGLACNKPPSSTCFCLSVGGSPVSTDGLDVQMTDLGDRYFVKAITETGKALMKAAGSLLAEAAAADQKQVKQVHADAVAYPQRKINDPDGAPAKLKASFNSPLWDEMARACIGCGICTFLCPTCHCFDINDEVQSKAPLKGQRVRTWDNCQFPDFTMHSSGHNPRENTGARLRQRVNHKFQYFHENFGMHQCTGCGRCVSECPVGIDIVAVVNKVTENVG